MNIVYAGDKNYFPHIGISIASLIRFDKPEKIFLLTDSTGSKNADELLNYCTKNGIDLRIIEVDLSSLKLKVSKKITLATYYRLLLPNIMPDINKVIYLDGDTIIVKSLKVLWNLDIRNSYVAAVKDMSIANLLRINLFGKDIPYFNAGVLVINLKIFRENKLTEQMLDFAQKHKEKIVYHDQCVLNYFLQNKWFGLPEKYNLMACHLLNHEQFIDDIKNPVIIHFNSYYGKPWDYYCIHPMKNTYLEVKNTTPWRSIRLTKRDWLAFYRRKIVILDLFLLFLRKILNKIHR
jgi:lipopolysaccharide biosynthesis glycosyltransferase